MRLIMWILTIAFALTGLSLWADHGAFLGLGPRLGDLAMKGFFFLAILACPFLWARSYGFVPRMMQVPGKQRLFMALAMLFAIPLVLPWGH